MSRNETLRKSRVKHLPSTTTVEEDNVTAGQRKVNLIWEYTQAIIAIGVIFTTMLSGLLVVIAKMYYNMKDLDIPVILGVAFGTVIGFYFGKTNHSAIGGLGKKPTQKYIGR